MNTLQQRHHARALVAVRLLHTVVWAFFVACIVGIPIAAALGRFRFAAILTAIVLLECLILFANRFRCPLTDVAARYTQNRAPDFDIYLPRWLAEHNKTVFGILFVAGAAFALLRFVLSPGAALP